MSSTNRPKLSACGFELNVRKGAHNHHHHRQEMNHEMNMTLHVNKTLSFVLIGRGGPVPWPPISPDFTPLDFYLWGHLKAVVYSTPVNNAEELLQRVENACQLISDNNMVFERTRAQNQSDSLMAADGDCHHLCKLMAPVRHRWSINDVIGGIRNTVMPSDCSPVRFGIRSKNKLMEKELDLKRKKGKADLKILSKSLKKKAGKSEGSCSECKEKKKVIRAVMVKKRLPAFTVMNFTQNQHLTKDGFSVKTEPVNSVL
ncbi:hypothetical protein ANN_23061 [Periplaneta americana]|uniref:Uncharacterized protein n=1 Tax=Periplaneta americana TaxID=6978 RepID=A0ABQ8SK16_PERAM|nr:hypothetical protein ANN_23061 [Periplaneta americana]